MLYAIFAVLVIILDQGVKYWVAGSVPLNLGVVPLIPDIVSIVNIRNDGAAFGFLAGSNARMYFIILTGVFTLAVIIMLATKFVSGSLARWSLVLVMAGGLSNCIDRVIYGYVQDMFKLEFVNFPVFNVADIFITVFALLFVLAILFERDRKREDYDFDDEDYDEDEDEDEEEEEDERPARRFGRRDKRASRRAAYDDEDEEDEDEEDERPARRSQKSRPAPRKAPRYDDEDEDEDEEDEEDERPARRGLLSRFGARKASRYEDEDDEEEEEDEEPAPRRRAAREEAPAAGKRTSKYAAQYESVKARKQASATPQYEVQAAPVDLDRFDSSRLAPPLTPAEPLVPAPAPKPKAPAEPVIPAAPAPKASSSEAEFSLEDILAEFK